MEFNKSATDQSREALRGFLDRANVSLLGRFPIRVLPSASGNGLWVSAVPSNVGYWGKVENFRSETSAFEPDDSATLARTKPIK
jgi:hypothetical protein